MINKNVVLPPAMPLYPSINELNESNLFINQYIAEITIHKVDDAGVVYEHSLDWLSEQTENVNNFKSYRSELTSFLYWCWNVAGLSVADLDRKTLREFIEWCRNPPLNLQGTCNYAQFVKHVDYECKIPNEKWRPFTKRRVKGSDPLMNNELVYRLSDTAIQTKLSILSSFYQYLNCIEHCECNPAAILLKMSKFKPIRSQSGDDDDELKFFSPLQWSYVIDAAELMAKEAPETHERTLFIIKLLYGTYCRISEISARPGYEPIMSQFRRDKKTGYWGFLVPQSKGGKRRTVSVPNELLAALTRYRKFRGLSDLPLPNESEPIFIRHRAAQHGRDAKMIRSSIGTRYVREIVQEVFDRAAELLVKDNFDLDAAEVRLMTVHSIRHTGISNDIARGRPLQHVQADAGHESLDVTSLYVHTSRAERHESSAERKLNPLDC
ncbi:tyrosine-type recombinase/integrase [Photobacterium iliopiscarium]|uniref:tyrosine-type recombinase/integrase n=1 Tax=Photobacterium iliopiscarium TaxID=56192 RepID=UPI001E513AE2|nr:site-specific integrase [Photobacterium iliopiscarium]